MQVKYFHFVTPSTIFGPILVCSCTEIYITGCTSLIARKNEERIHIIYFSEKCFYKNRETAQWQNIPHTRQVNDSSSVNSLFQVITSLETAHMIAMSKEGTARARYNFNAQTSVELPLKKVKLLSVYRLL